MSIEEAIRHIDKAIKIAEELLKDTTKVIIPPDTTPEEKEKFETLAKGLKDGCRRTRP